MVVKRQKKKVWVKKMTYLDVENHLGGFSRVVECVVVVFGLANSLSCATPSLAMCQEWRLLQLGESSSLGTLPSHLGTNPSPLGTVPSETWVCAQTSLQHHIC